MHSHMKPSSSWMAYSVSSRLLYEKDYIFIWKWTQEDCRLEIISYNMYTYTRYSNMFHVPCFDHIYWHSSSSSCSVHSHLHTYKGTYNIMCTAKTRSIQQNVTFHGKAENLSCFIFSRIWWVDTDWKFC